MKYFYALIPLISLCISPCFSCEFCEIYLEARYHEAFYSMQVEILHEIPDPLKFHKVLGQTEAYLDVLDYIHSKHP